jgi:SAM-dependent methyltransferase
MNPGLNYPEVFARFYDIIYDHIRKDEDQSYYLRKIGVAKGPVLEVGVGTGRFFIEALDKGADIYGIDISKPMIDVLKRKLPEKEHHRVSVQDVCELKTGRKYDLIIAPFRVFQHLITIEQQLKGLTNIYDHLNQGGTFIFDLFIPNVKMLAEGWDEVNDFDGEYKPGLMLQRFTSMEADTVNQISRITFRFVWEEEDGEGISYNWSTEIRLVFRYELEHLLYRSKFKDYKIFGDFLGHELTKDSKEFVVVCKR